MTMPRIRPISTTILAAMRAGTSAEISVAATAPEPDHNTTTFVPTFINGPRPYGAAGHASQHDIDAMFA
jgi:hypothetical protein